MSPPEVISSTMPLLYETGFDDWPYAFAGSCFPVRWKNALYIVSAFHCFENHGLKPESTLYPIPSSPNEFFGFSHTLRAKLPETQDMRHYDQIVLQVSNELHPIQQTAAVKAIDLSDDDNIAKLSEPDTIHDVWLRGYPLQNPSHLVDSEKKKIKPQALVTNGFVSSRKSPSAHCSYVKVQTPSPFGWAPNGMSGSAVYVTDVLGKTRFAGTLIEFNELTDEFLVIDPTPLHTMLKMEHSSSIEA